ncbi:hypothetical protein [Ferirhizobium litorale]|nr:hypothetical protein [Fererhizobium litorale]
MQPQSIPQQTIPQHVLDRMEDEWRQMRSASTQQPRTEKPKG